MTHPVVTPILPAPPAVLGVSPAAETLRTAVADLSAAPDNLVLTGEPGTGKRFFAGLLLAARAGGRIVPLCPQTPEEELRVVLFEEERRRIEGMLGHTLERLRPGDLLLVRNPRAFSILGQTRLARFLIQTDPAARRQAAAVRVVFTMEDDAAGDGAERGGVESLAGYLRAYRRIAFPPLRERREDIPHFVRAFLEADNPGRAPFTVDQPALDVFLRLPYPDNIRELRVLLREAAAASPEGRLHPPPGMPDEAAGVRGMVRDILHEKGVHLESSLEALERSLVRRALVRTGWNRVRAAALLGLTELHIRYRMKKYGLTEPDGAGEPPPP